MALRYEGVRFSDGSIAVRRVSEEPWERVTRTFESMAQLEDDIGSDDVTWLHHPGKLDQLQVEKARRLAARTGTLMCRDVVVNTARYGHGKGYCARCGVSVRGLIGAYRDADGADYCSKAHHDVGRRVGRYEPEEEVDEP